MKNKNKMTAKKKPQTLDDLFGEAPKPRKKIKKQIKKKKKKQNIRTKVEIEIKTSKNFDRLIKQILLEHFDMKRLLRDFPDAVLSDIFDLKVKLTKMGSEYLKKNEK